MSLFGWGSDFLYVILARSSIDVHHIAGRPPAHLDSKRLEPRVALDPAGDVVAIGKTEIALVKQDRPDVEVRSLTDHPRVLVADFGLYTQVLQSTARSLTNKRSFRGPAVIIQQEDLIEGGLSPLEVRALIELGETIGAHKVAVRQGRPLVLDDFHDLDAVEDGWCADPGISG